MSNDTSAAEARRAARKAKVERRRAAAAARRAQRRAMRGMKWSNREYVPMQLAPFQETTSSIQGLYPFIAEAGIDAPGILVGRNLLSSGSFVYDVFELYKRGMLLNPNGLIQGTVGSGKSSLVKTTIARDAAFGIKSVVPCDPKGEYTRLARWMGYQPIFLGPGLRTRLNPLDVPPRPVGLSDEDWVREITNARISLLAALAGATLGRSITPAERKAITQALRRLTGGALRSCPSWSRRCSSSPPMTRGRRGSPTRAGFRTRPATPTWSWTGSCTAISRACSTVPPRHASISTTTSSCSTWNGCRSRTRRWR
ncbi:MAG: hypothetical protein ACR2LI_11115 [Propionibacteriaceae bacterium]